MKQWVVLGYETLPIFTSFGHNLKQKNTFKCDAELISNMPNYYIMHKKFMYQDKEVCILSTHLKMTFVRGFLYYNDKEYEIIEYNTYASLQIEDYCYDNVSVVRLLENPF